MTPRDLLSDFDFGPGDTQQALLYARLLLLTPRTEWTLPKNVDSLR